MLACQGGVVPLGGVWVMAIRFRCASCRVTLVTSIGIAGTGIECPRCKGATVIPGEFDPDLGDGPSIWNEHLPPADSGLKLEPSLYRAFCQVQAPSPPRQAAKSDGLAASPNPGGDTNLVAEEPDLSLTYPHDQRKRRRAAAVAISLTLVTAVAAATALASLVHNAGNPNGIAGFNPSDSGQSPASNEELGTAGTVASDLSQGRRGRIA